MKIIKSMKCPNCHKLAKFENNPEFIGAGGIFGRFISILILMCIPVIGWIMAFFTFISIFKDKKGEGDLYCSHCGYKITLKKDWTGKYKDI